jgi:hypothetical protein
MVQDDNNVYWLPHPVGDTTTWNVNTVYESGGSATQLAIGEPDVHHVVLSIDELTLYYLRQTVPQTDLVTWEIAAVPTDGSQLPTALVGGITAPDILAGSVDWAPITASSPPQVLYYLQAPGTGTAITAYSTRRSPTAPAARSSRIATTSTASSATRSSRWRRRGSATASLATVTGQDQLIGAIVTTDGGSVPWEQLLDGDDGCAFQGMNESEVGWPNQAIFDASCPVASTLGDPTYEAPLVTDDTNVYFDGPTVYSAPCYTD